MTDIKFHNEPRLYGFDTVLDEAVSVKSGDSLMITEENGIPVKVELVRDTVVHCPCPDHYADVCPCSQHDHE